MRRIAVLVGTRPEVIKMAPVAAALRASGDLEPIVLSTGQHREMLRQAAGAVEMGIDVDLDVMQPGQTLAGLTSRLITAIDGALERLKPDMALVQGDTTTVLAGSLASFYRGVPVGHVEAGLRTGDLSAPFPEEANRRLASVLAGLHFPPTERARENLVREGVDPRAIEVTGNTVIDALFMEVARQDAGTGARYESALAERLGRGWAERPMVLITGHRRESFGSGFEEICAAIKELSERFGGHTFVYPVHLNPNVREVVNARLGGVANVKLIEPVGYGEFVMLLRRCVLALTDSGGVQEEAPAFGKPALVMRDTTERPEGIEAGTAALVGADRGRIVGAVTRLLTDRGEYDRMARAKNPYGDGAAAGRIVSRVRRWFDGGR
jgi:UDP-N-acetylglucosamine 2-epimerase (non-hydrolysing)